ncbi:hypothetical protein, partial [Micromonospora sp. NPDC003776]
MRDEEELRDRLRAVDVPDSRIEVDALVQAGRRRAFRRHSVGGAHGHVLPDGSERETETWLLWAHRCRNRP